MTTRSAAGVLAEAAQAAGLAPSVHNTQPWRWRVHPDHLDLYAERSRQLRATDPEGRLLAISCGTALHHARVALAAAGWQPDVDRMPEGRDHVARLRLGGQVGVAAAAIRQYQAAEIRRTDRRPLTGTPVPAAALAAVRAAVEAEHAHLHMLRPEQISALVAAAGRAEAQEAADPQARAELSYWVGGPHPAGTGLPQTAIPTHPPHTAVPVRDFGSPGKLPAGDPAGQRGDAAASYALIFTDQDTPADWLAAGEALSAAWLAATEHGVALLPFSAPVETTATRAVLRRVLAGIGQPQIVLRLGLADPDHPGPPHTPRLDPTQTVEIVGAGQ